MNTDPSSRLAPFIPPPLSGSAAVDLAAFDVGDEGSEQAPPKAIANYTQSRSSQASGLPSGVAELLGNAADTQPTAIAPFRWEPLVVSLIVGGMSVDEAAIQVKRTPEEVACYLASDIGRAQVKSLIEERPIREIKLLTGVKVDVTLSMIKVLHTSKHDTAKVAAGKVLLELAQDASGKRQKSPEEIKREAEERLRKQLARKARETEGEVSGTDQPPSRPTTNN